MKSNSMLRNAVRMALASGMATAFVAPAAMAQDNDEEARELDRVQVTGSRIQRTDLEGSLPVTTIDREQIELSGESNAADLIRNMPFNSSGSYRPQSGSSFGGAALVSLRGIGADRTLVLIDGRRQPKSPLTGSTNDLSTIPLGAIERIEILSDGASAVYGSDAIGGVINVILRTDFEGAELMIGAADVDPEGGDRREGHAVFGTSGPSGRIIAGASWNSRDIIFARDFPWYTPGGSIYGNNYTTLTGGFDNFDWTALPGACEEMGSDAFYTLGSICAYNFALVSADEASSGNKSAFVKADHYINDDWSVWMNINVNKGESFGRYAPVPDSTFFGSPLSADSLNNPTNPDGYFGDQTGLPQQEVNIWHRFDALGNRDNFINTEVADLMVGTTGYVGGMEVEFGGRQTYNKVYDIGENYLVRTTAFNYIEDGIYDLSDPYGNPDDVLNAMKATISRIARYDQQEIFGSIAFDAGATGAGPMQWFVGAEYRTEDYEDRYDSLSEAGQIGGSAGNSAGLDRDVTSVFGEGLVPLTDRLELNVAGRFDSYSDYGDDFSPKLSLRWDATDDLVIRGSYGQGFRAPSLDILSQQTAFSADSVRDPQTCEAQGQPADCTTQINAYRIANPDLESEKSEQFSIGAAWAPVDWFNGTLDYYRIEIDERIAFFSSQNLINREQRGDPIPPGLGITRAPSGAITEILTGYGNEGELKTDGVDINLRANTEFGGGRFQTNLQASYVLGFSIDDGPDLSGDPGLPRMRATWSNQYSIGDFSFAWNVNYIGNQCDQVANVEYVTAPELGTVRECRGNVPSWTTNDVQFNYFTPFDGRVTLGAQNVGNKMPPVGLGNIGSRDYDFNLYNGYGRIVYARYTQSF